MSILIAGQPVIRVGQTWTRNRDHARYAVIGYDAPNRRVRIAGRTRYWVSESTLRRTYTLTEEA